MSKRPPLLSLILGYLPGKYEYEVLFEGFQLALENRNCIGRTKIWEQDLTPENFLFVKRVNGK